MHGPPWSALACWLDATPSPGINSELLQIAADLSELLQIAADCCRLLACQGYLLVLELVSRR